MPVCKNVLGRSVCGRIFLTITIHTYSKHQLHSQAQKGYDIHCKTVTVHELSHRTYNKYKNDMTKWFQCQNLIICVPGKSLQTKNYTFFQQGCINLSKVDSKDFYIVNIILKLTILQRYMRKSSSHNYFQLW